MLILLSWFNQKSSHLNDRVLYRLNNFIVCKVGRGDKEMDLTQAESITTKMENKSQLWTKSAVIENK